MRHTSMHLVVGPRRGAHPLEEVQDQVVDEGRAPHPLSRPCHSSEKVPACTMTSTPMQHSRIGTARCPSRSMTPRAPVAAPRQDDQVTSTSPTTKTADDGAQVGRPADPEERDVDGQVVAARGDGDQRRRREAPPDRPLLASSRQPRVAARRRRGFRRSRSSGCGRARPRGRARRWPAAPARAGRPTAAENSYSTAAAAAATATTTTNPTTWPAAMRRARSKRRARHHGHGHHAVVDVGADERDRGDADVGRQAGGQGRRQLAGSGIAGPKGLSPRRVTRWAKRAASP